MASFLSDLLGENVSIKSAWREVGLVDVTDTDLKLLADYVHAEKQGNIKEELACAIYGFRNDYALELKKDDLYNFKKLNHDLYLKRESNLIAALDDFESVAPSAKGYLETVKAEIKKYDFPPEDPRILNTKGGRSKRGAVVTFVHTLKAIWDKNVSPDIPQKKWIDFASEVLNVAGYKASYGGQGPRELLASEKLIRDALKSSPESRLYLLPSSGGRSAWAIAPLKSEISNLKKKLRK